MRRSWPTEGCYAKQKLLWERRKIGTGILAMNSEGMRPHRRPGWMCTGLIWLGGWTSVRLFGFHKCEEFVD
jgi:hypothetical protein